MKPNVDIPIGAAGITAPVWLDAVNQWLGLVLVILSIILVGVRLYHASKTK